MCLGCLLWFGEVGLQPACGILGPYSTDAGGDAQLFWTQTIAEAKTFLFIGSRDE